MVSPDHGLILLDQGWPDDLIVVNLQGDEPLMPPSLMDQCAGPLDSADVGTLGSELDATEDYDDPNVVKVVVDSEDNALYFSRAAIPFIWDNGTLDAARGAALRHHGMYAYRRHVLASLVAAEPCTMEECENLEQLRALWLGIRIKVGPAEVCPGPGVDTEEDVTKVSAALSQG